MIELLSGGYGIMQGRLDIKRVQVSTEEFSPRVLKSYFFALGRNFPKGHRFRERYVYDYELEFFTYSAGSMLIENTVYPINKGDIVFRRPGQLTQGIMPYDCYFICFDLLGHAGKDPETYDFNKPQEFQPYYCNNILDAIPIIYTAASPEKYHELFESVLKEYIAPNECSQLVMKSYVLKILYELYRDSRNPLSNHSIKYSYHYPVIKKVVEYIQDNIESKLDLKMLSELSGLSPNYFHRVFTENLGITPNDYITKIRLDKARELLVKTSLPVSEISFRCGFENIPYFSYLFKKHLGISPGKFRKKHSYIYL